MDNDSPLYNICHIILVNWFIRIGDLLRKSTLQRVCMCFLALINEIEFPFIQWKAFSLNIQTHRLNITVEQWVHTLYQTSIIKLSISNRNTKSIDLFPLREYKGIRAAVLFGDGIYFSVNDNGLLVVKCEIWLQQLRHLRRCELDCSLSSGPAWTGRLCSAVNMIDCSTVCWLT